MMMLVAGIACCPADFVGGMIFDRLGTYPGTFELNMVVAALAIVALIFATTPRQRDATGFLPDLAKEPA